MYLLRLITAILILTASQVSAEEPEGINKAVKAGIILLGMTEEDVVKSIGEPYVKKQFYWWYPGRKLIYFKTISG